MTIMSLENVKWSIPFSPEQRALLALSAADKAGKTAGLVALIDIEGHLDRGRLQAVAESLLKRHEILQFAVCHVTGFRGLRMQPLDSVPPISWEEFDLRGLDDTTEVLREEIKKFSDEPLTIEYGELLRLGLFRVDEERHVLALVACSLGIDSGSVRILLDQLETGYASQSVFAPGDSFQYSQFVAWRQELESDEDALQGRQYWQNYIAESQALTSPRLCYRKRSLCNSKRSESSTDQKRLLLSGCIDNAFASNIVKAAAVIGSTADTLLQGVWWLTLARLTGFERFIGGWQHDCRRDYEVMEGAIGVYEKVLPVVVDVKADERFTEWLTRLDAVLTAHREGQEYWAVEAPPVTAHLEVGFEFYERAIRGPGGGWRAMEIPGSPGCFELALEVEWAEERAELKVRADASCYSREAIAGLLDQFLTLLQGVVEEPGQPVAQLPIVGVGEREALLTINDAYMDVGHQTLSERVAEWAQIKPDMPAIEMGAARLSYRELDARANRMAHWLLDQGVTPRSLVALNLPRSPELILAILAVWRAGAGYLPLEPEWPEGRRRSLLADANPALVLSAEVSPLDASDTQWREASLDEVELDGFSDAPPGRTVELQDIAYVLFTSGSTGRPKGVVIEHRQLLNYLAAASEAMHLSACRRWASINSVVADLGNTALFGALFNGACLVIADSNEVNDAEAFASFIRTREIDALKIVPSHLEALLECDAPCLPRTLILGGEAPSPTLIERAVDIAPACALYNHYGPTESTVGVMVHPISAEDDLETFSLTKVLANNKVYVLDETGQLVPRGGLGEVYIGGAQLFRGYLNRDVNETFIASAFQTGERLYGTGDYAYVLPEGGIRLAGRIDHRVKIRGFRVEPAEVEAALQTLAGVRQAVVSGLPNGAGETELVAFVLVDREGEIEVDTLRDRLAASLPSHMLPTKVIYVAEFPRLPNGKIDRLALASLKPLHEKKRACTPPRNPVEFVLADCVAALLKRESVGIDEDFFGLGGHSLLVVKLVARIRKILQVEIAPGLVFDHPTVAELAEALRGDERGGHLLDEFAERYRQTVSKSPV